MEIPIQLQRSLKATTDFYEKIRYSNRFFHYIGALILGLGLAKAFDASVLYYIGSKRPAKSIVKKTRNNASARRLNDASLVLSSIVGGVFYVDAVGEAAPGATATTPTEDAINFTLLGTLEGPRSFARAVLQVQGEPQTKEFGLYKKVGIAKILSINNGYIWFRQSGKKYKLKNGQSTAQLFKELNEAAIAKPTAIKAVADASPAAGQVITKVLSRQRVNSLVFGNVAKIYQGASFGPKLENGKIVGYKIHKVNQGHIFYELGARSGDIIKKINGFGLGDTERMFELWRSMKTTPRIKLQIERNKKVFTYDFHIRN